MFLQQVINSLMIGSLYALTAMGATLIYGILGILDIANAGAYLLGAYVGYYVYTATGSLVLAFLVAMAVIGLLGVGFTPHDLWSYSCQAAYTFYHSAGRGGRPFYRQQRRSASNLRRRHQGI